MPNKKRLAIFVAVLSVALGFLAITTPVYAASSEKVLYAFQGGKQDGSEPLANLIFGSSGNLYGTTYTGGIYKDGTVLELTPKNGQWTEKVLHIFQGKYGSQPTAGLVVDKDGNLYGTLSNGGPHNGGSVFELMPSNGEWSLKVLHAFIDNGKDGVGPKGGLVFDFSGNLYGTTAVGGAFGLGTVFELLNDGEWTYKRLYSFNGKDGVSQPQAGLILDKAGNLYGTTYDSVFELMRSGGKWIEKRLHQFKHNGYDGYECLSSLTMDTNGNLYGTTALGGADSSCDNFAGCGTVFELTPNKNGTWAEKLLHSFHGKGDGYYPLAGLVSDSSGNLYGTTAGGGESNDGYGVVFELTPNDGKWTETVLYIFTGDADGGSPGAGLIFDSAGDLFGTTSGGGVGNGVVFEIAL